VSDARVDEPLAAESPGVSGLEGGPVPGSDDPRQTLESSCRDQAERWRAGHRVPAEAYLAQHPALAGDDDLAFELVYNEFALRESLGDAPDAEEFAWRFPRFADRLRRQLDFHRALDEGDIDKEPTPPPARVAAGGLDVPGYEILEELGRGGAGVVYKARQEGLNRLVALKVIRDGVCDDPGAAARFRSEAEAAARFQHPNLVQVYEVGEYQGLAYLALEYASGGNLQQKLAATPQDPAESARLVASLAGALYYAHQRGIVHRDLKPANVVLAEDGVPKVTDFGLAKLLEHENGPTRTGDILGTPSYMAPEQARSDAAGVTPSADVYALGAILYETLAGRPPFKGPTPLATLEQVLSQEPIPPSKFEKGTPRDLETICLKCLEKDPRRRYASAAELADDLNRFLDGSTITARPASTLERAWKWGRRRPGAAAATITTALALAALLAGALYAGARLSEKNTSLELAAQAARTAERSAKVSAMMVKEQRNLALNALKELVFGVQDKLGESPANRPLRRSLLDTATAGLDEIARSAEATAPDLARAVAHQKLGEIYYQVGRADDATRQFDQARHLAEDLAAVTPGDPKVSDCLARAEAGLGELAIDARRHDEALAHLLRSVDLAESIARAGDDREESRRGLAEAYFQLGRAYGFQGDLARAEARFSRMRDLASRWAEERPTEARYRDMLASSHRKLGDMKKLAHDHAAARAEYLRAIEAGEACLAIEPGDLAYKAHLAMAVQDLAGVAHRDREDAEARALFARAEALFASVAEADPEDQLVQVHLTMAQADLGRLERDAGDYARAAALFRRALDRVDRLDREGRLVGRPDFRATLLPSLPREIADCEAAPEALGEIGGLTARPSHEACRLLATRARLLTGRLRGHEVVATARALCKVRPGTGEDHDGLARSLAACLAGLDDGRWPGPPSPEWLAARDLCADRALASLRRAAELGFTDLKRIESDPDLAPLRGHPGYRELVERPRRPDVLSPNGPTR
jgi:tetratricopeptide (TPR) repeat protein